MATSAFASAMANVMPLPRRRKRSWLARAVTEDDSIFRLVGKFRSGIPGSMSGRKHEFLKKV